MIALDELNELPVAAFTEALGAIFEHSPWVAAGAASSRPFDSRLDLLDGLRAIVRDAPPGDQLGLIRAHPQLGARGRKRQELTAASSQEQRRAGLDACSDAEFAELMRMNAAYVEKFDFPFILAVRGHDPESILASMRTRLDNTPDQERHTALTQIGLIAGYRLADVVSSPPAAEVRAMQARIGGINTSPGAALLVREWMLAAGFDIRAGIGVAAPTSIPNPHFLFGAYLDLTNHVPRRDGSLATLLGIAVAQDLRLRQLPTRYTLLVAPFPGKGPQGTMLTAAAQDPIQGPAILSLAELDPVIPLGAVGITGHHVLLASRTIDTAASPATTTLAARDTVPSTGAAPATRTTPATDANQVTDTTLERTLCALERLLSIHSA